MEYKAPLETYSGGVREMVLGKGNKALKIGGENVLPFHYFEGKVCNQPRLALEIHDSSPSGWADWMLEPYRGVIDNPVSWAKKCVELGADLVCLRLTSTDPTGENKTADSAAQTTKAVSEAIGVPLIVYGTGDETKDIEVLTRVAEACSGQNLLMGPALKENYEPIAAAALKNDHCLIAQTPIDINLEKELNIKLSKMFPPERIAIDPMSSALGYGMEYSFTIIERTKHTAIMFKDAMMQMPVIADLSSECARTKEAKANKTQGLAWELATAMSLLLAGANILVLRHPESLKLIKEVIENKI